MKKTAVIVARSGSVRIKNKALCDIGGETLLARKVRQVLACNALDEVIVGSDSDEILESVSGFNVTLIKRPDKYCDERISTANDMIENMCSLFTTDIVVWTHCTNPLISSGTYDKAICSFLDNMDKYDSLLSVHKFQEHLWDDSFRPLNYDPWSGSHTLSVDLPFYYMQDGGIFIQPYEQMLHNRYFFGKSPQLFIIPESEYLDINYMSDLENCRNILECEKKY
jgi:CMP-N-acetylneuraminic acid synthetase